MMKEKGLPESMVRKIAGFNADIKNGQEVEVTDALEDKLRGKPASLKDGLKVLFEF